MTKPPTSNAARGGETMSPAAFPTMKLLYVRRRICTRPPMIRDGITYMLRSPSTMKNSSIVSGS